MRSSTAVALALGLALALGARAPDEQRFRVRAAQADGEWRCSVFAERAAVRELVDALARQCGVSVEGFEQVSRTALVDADLSDRPVRQALECVLGSVGLRVEPRVGVWHVRASLRAPADPARLREQAQSAYLAALREFPDHPAGAGALLGQGEIELARGHLAAALAHFDGLVERYPDAPEVPEALLRAGGALERLGDWEQAAGRFADLLRLEQEHPHEVEGRLELARCSVWLGAGDRALAMLDALDSIQPPADAADERARLLVRARALQATSAPQRALDLLEQLAAQPLSHAELREALELRAAALEELERPADAARAWIAYSQETSGGERTIGLRHAARLALAAGDELAVLFVHEMAEDEGAADATAEAARQARENLALEESSPRNASPAERLARAEELLASGRAREAHDVLELLHLSRTQLEADELARFALARGRTLARTQGVDAALAALRELVPALADSQARREVYLLAGELLEETGRVDEAIEAYRGRL